MLPCAHCPGPVASLISNKAFTALALNPMVNGLAVTGSMDPLIRMWDLRSKGFLKRKKIISYCQNNYINKIKK
jgi:hypothetical protein